MRPLFPDKNNLEEIQGEGEKRKKYRIRIDCRWVGQHLIPNGKETVNGDWYDVLTNSGKPARVWVANDQSIAENLKYFCHGYSFGTYEEFGYSILQVYQMLDEWDIVGKTIKVERMGSEVRLNMEQLKEHHVELFKASAGHYLVAVGLAEPGLFDHVSSIFWSGALSPLETVHSFRIDRIEGVVKDFLESQASSKNTFELFDRHTTIKGQLDKYKNIAALTFLKPK